MTIYFVDKFLYELDGPTSKAAMFLLNICWFKSHSNFHFGFVMQCMADNSTPSPMARYVLLQSLCKWPPAIDETVLPDAASVAVNRVEFQLASQNPSSIAGNS